MKISVPISLNTLENCHRDSLLKRLSQLGAEEVLLCYAALGFDAFVEEERAASIIKEYDEFLKGHGFQTALWASTLGAFAHSGYTPLTTINGKPLCLWACPMDAGFGKAFCRVIEKIAALGIAKIVLEDDFRMQCCEGDISCFCEQHMKFYSEYLGRAVTREEMKDGLFNSAPNQYREAWMAGCRKGLEDLARQIRASADEVNKNLSFVLCCGPALFGGDGTDPEALRNILSGDNAPAQLRLIGAPYWSVFNNPLNAVIDFPRRQAFECSKAGIECYGEGDPYPRPRYTCSATEVEFYHTVLLADGHCDRLFKYGCDYTSSFDYEKGYAERAEENRELYAQIKEMFHGKKCVGFHPLEPFDKVKRAHRLAMAPEHAVMDTALRRYTSSLSLPTAFEKGGVNLIFGENARCVECEDLKYGAVLDMAAAMILQERGIDVGIEKTVKHTPGETGHGLPVYDETYFEEKEVVGLYGKPVSCLDLVLKAGAKEESKLHIIDRDYTGSYTYENADGRRFLIYNFDMDEMVKTSGWVRSYCRQAQLARLYPWLNGSPVDAICLGNPDLYLLAKKDDNSLAIGLWNYSKDKILNPVVQLGRRYANIKIVGGEGRLEGDKIMLTTQIKAYEFCFIEVTK
jgi:hypothetical protein